MSLISKDTYNYITNEIDYEKLADAIVAAQEKKENNDMEKFKNKKVSLFTKFTFIVFVSISVFMILFSISSFAKRDIISGSKIILMSVVFAVLGYTLFIVAKTADKNYRINIVAVILALVAIVLDVIQ